MFNKYFELWLFRRSLYRYNNLIGSSINHRLYYTLAEYFGML